MSTSQLETYPFLAICYAIFIYAALLAISAGLDKLNSIARNVTVSSNRYGSLDGFRGVLAIGVFVHHSFTAYGYFTQGRWEWSLSPVFNHLGQTTVALFFMITGFLFALKSMSPRIDWKGFYLSRFARLFPLYALVVCYVFATVFIITQGALQESAWRVLREFIQWLAFVYFDRPNVNGLPKTWILIAGVNWSLRYEVIFYVFAVPVLYFLSRIFSSRTALLILASLLLGLLMARFYYGEGSTGSLPKDLTDLDLTYAAHFLCGIVTAHAYREPRILGVMQSLPYRIVAGIFLLFYCVLPTPSDALSILLTMLLFSAVVSGLSIWGLLNTRAALWLGDISYGIYLLHGAVLWLALSALKSNGVLAGIGALAYFFIMCLVGAIVVMLATISYIHIERPAMALAKRWTDARRRLLIAELSPAAKT